MIGLNDIKKEEKRNGNKKSQYIEIIKMWKKNDLQTVKTVSFRLQWKLDKKLWEMIIIKVLKSILKPNLWLL